MATTLRTVADLPKPIPGSHRWAAPWDDIQRLCDELASEGDKSWVVAAEDKNASLVSHLRKGGSKFLDPDVYEFAFSVTSYEPKKGTVYARRRPT